MAARTRSKSTKKVEAKPDVLLEFKKESKRITQKEVKKVEHFEKKISVVCCLFALFIVVVQLLIIVFMDRTLSQTKVLNVAFGSLTSLGFLLVYLKESRKKLFISLFFLNSLVCAYDNEYVVSILFFAVGVCVLYYYGFFKEKTRSRAVLTLATFITIIVAVSIISNLHKIVFFLQYGTLLTIIAFIIGMIFSKQLNSLLYKQPEFSLTKDGGLTEEQAKIVMQAFDFKTNKEIAYDLDINDNTLRTSFTRIYDKLGVAGRSDIFLKFLKYDVVL